MSCYLHTTYFLLSNICLVVFMCHLFSCEGHVFMAYLFSCLSWLRAVDTAFLGAICRVWKERVCTIPFPLQERCFSLQTYCFSLQKRCFSLQNHCLSLHKDKTHVDNEQISCCSSICTTSLVPQILWSARALSSEVAMLNYLWLSPSTQL